MGHIYFETVLNDFVSKYVVTQNIFPLLLRYGDCGLIVVRVYYFQIWNKKKEHNINIRVINGHIGPMYIEKPYNCSLYMSQSLSSHSCNLP